MLKEMNKWEQNQINIKDDCMRDDIKEEYTPKGKPKDGFYYNCQCPRDGKVYGVYVTGGFVCDVCNNDKGVKHIKGQIQ